MRHSFRLSLLLVLFAAMIATPPAFAAPKTIVVHGALELSITADGGKGTVQGANLGGANVRRKDSATVVLEQEGKQLGEIARSADGTFTLKGIDGKTSYFIKRHDSGYQLFDGDDHAINRVKIKEDKFNLYDAGGTRLMHGKQKPDGWGVKDEKDEQIYKIKGGSSLKEVSYFALPIEAKFRLLAWAGEFLD